MKRSTALMVVLTVAATALAVWAARGRAARAERGYWTISGPVDSDHNRRFPPGHPPVEPGEATPPRT